jgi:hypothetical protein
MPLNNIRLSAGLVSEMYRNSLVELDEFHETGKENFDSPNEIKKTREDQPVIGDWKYLGDYKKSILLIVNYPGSAHLPDEQLNFITSFLTPCKLSLGDVAILNIAEAPSPMYKDVQTRFISKVTVLFGLTPAAFSMPVNFPEFQIQALNNCTFLSTPSLETMENDKVLKSKLWVCLRKIFGI